MSIKVGTGNTGVSGIYFGTNKTVQSVYLGNSLVWSASANVFTISLSPTTLSSSGGTGTVTFSFGVSDYSFETKPSWVSNVTTTTSSGKVTGLTFSYEQNTGSQRTENLTFFANGTNRTVQLTQAATSTISVTGVSLNKASTTITAGSTEQLTATVTPSNATDKSVVWSSSNTSVATVSSGLVTAVAAGSATITVRTNDGNYTATCTATIAAATFSVSPPDLTFAHNESTVSSAKAITITTTQSWTVTSITSTFAVYNNVTSGTGDTTIYVYPKNANTGNNTDKTGSIKIKPNVGSEVTVGLVQYAQTYTLSVTPTTLDTFDYDDDTAAEGKTVTVVADHAWSASITSGFYINSSGTTTASGSSGTTYLTIFPSSTNSVASDITGTLTVRGTGSGYVRTVELTQGYNPDLVVFLIDSLSFAGTGETKYITATSGTINSWQITSAPDWCSYTTGVVQSSSIPITASANNGSEARMYDLVLTVNGIEGYIVALDQPSASAVNYTFTVVPSPSDATVKLTVNGSTTTGTSVSCTAGTTVYWEVSKTNYVTQSGSYKMTAANHTKNVTLVYNYTLSVSPNSLTFDYDKYGYVSGSKLVTITSNQSWTMTATGVFRIGSSAATTASGSGNGSYSIFPNSTNTGSSARTGTLTITGANSGSATVSLTQNYNTDALQSLSISGPDTLDIQDTSAYTVSYTPSGTSQTAVEWSVSGNANGELMDMGGYDAYVIYPTNNASVGDTVTVTVTSTVVSGKSASKSVTIVDELGPAVEPIDSVTISAVSGVTQGNTVYTQAVFSATVLPSTAEDKSVTWSLAKHPYGNASDLNRCSISTDSLGRCVFTVLSSATYPCWAYIVATSNADPSVSDKFEVVFMNRT